MRCLSETESHKGDCGFHCGRSRGVAVCGEGTQPQPGEFDWCRLSLALRRWFDVSMSRWGFVVVKGVKDSTPLSHPSSEGDR